MARKYLDRKDKKTNEKKLENFNDDNNSISKSGSEMENLDPLNFDEQNIILQKKQPLEKDRIEIAKDEINKAEQFVRTINTQLSERLLRIEKIKKSHENFEKELELLQFGKSKTQEKKIDEIVEDIVKEPEAIRVSKELSALIEKYVIEKLEMMKKLYESEKRQSRELNKKLQENLAKIAEAEERLKHQRDQLKLEVRDKTKKLIQVERLSAIGELSARLAHDLRNPLTVIKGTVEIIKTKNISSETSFSLKQIDMMERAISRMSHQIDDVLEFVKIQTLRTSGNSLFETIGLSVAKMKKSDGLTINMPQNDVEFVYDTDKLEVVIDNLLTNAAEAINNKGEITIRIKDFGQEVEIQVEDSGEGVPDNILKKVFEPLFTTKNKGTGLGLASCKSIIEQHGGSITVRNKPSLFTIKLPKMLEISTI